MKQYVLLSGGIGNQLFQYAFYCSLKRSGLNACLCTHLYEFNKMHNGYMLEKAFGIKSETEQSCYIKKFITRLVNRFPKHPIVYNETPFTYTEDVYKSNALFYKGCWMHSDFFQNFQNDLRNLLQFKSIDPINIKIAEEIQNSETISIHIRRGDYLNIPIANVCDSYYYKKAIKLVLEKVNNPFFYVFSDDPKWSKSFMEQFNVKFKIIDHNVGSDCYKDIFLMSRCKHNIIANSTFSWWGAWLNNNKNKMVIVPSLWNKKQKMEFPGKKIIVDV